MLSNNVTTVMDAPTLELNSTNIGIRNANLTLTHVSMIGHDRTPMVQLSYVGLVWNCAVLSDLHRTPTVQLS